MRSVNSGITIPCSIAAMMFWRPFSALRFEAMARLRASAISGSGSSQSMWDMRRAVSRSRSIPLMASASSCSSQSRRTGLAPQRQP
ncbi:hypothetical protein DW899_07575 [Collinsella sp. AM41-2BH]|nr:hypothetical protein DW899_07575 [Collinsella sp. AM41-2BH]